MTVPEGPAIFYNDLPSETANTWSSQLHHQAWPTFQTPLSHAAYKDVPSTYLLCEQDAAIPLVAQQAMAGFVGEGITTHLCKSGHSPFLSMPETVVNVIRKASGEPVSV
jgi:hypothetical protein